MTILDALNKTSDKWASDSQPGMAEANVTALGGSNSTYSIRFKNGNTVTNVSGPTGLSVGNSVTVANYPGKAKKFVILQKATGGGLTSPTVVRV